jgi:predicted RNA-binding Zn ribbon-like protein
VKIDSYADTGSFVAVDLVNAPVLDLEALRVILAVDPPSLAQLRRADEPGFVALAARLREVFADLRGGAVDSAATRLNALLLLHPAHPHLAKEDGVWRLHHHPAEVELVPMWTAICAEALARVLGAGEAHRLGTCAACDRVFFDVTKNASRRFCSTTCQNRVKAQAYRHRHAPERGRASGGRRVG